MLLRILDLVGIAAFAASGALVAVSKRFDIFGVCVVGVFTGIGGGVVRDVLLGIHPPKSLTSWSLFGAAAATSVLVFFVHSALGRMRREILVLDALGMGLFASTGAAIALGAGAGPLASALIGTTTAIGGGVLRDVLVNEVPLVLHRDLYAIPALLGAIVVVAGTSAGLAYNTVLVLGTVVATMLRLLALWRGWSLPGPRLQRD